MPLSEHEQKLLDEIEQALYAEDPKFASAYRANDLRRHRRRRIIRSLLLVVVGIALLAVGVALKVVALGVAGFVLMVVAASLAVAAWQRGALPRPVPPTVHPDPPRSGRRGIVSRLEQRWERRQDTF